METSSGLGCGGAPAGVTSVRTGEKAAASSTAIHRSGGSSCVNAATVAVPSLLPSARRERHSGLRRHRRQAQGPNDATDVDCSFDVGEPQAELLVLLHGQRLLQPGGELSGGFVTNDEGIVRGGHDTSQVTQVEVGELALGRLGPIEPIGDAELWQQVLGHLQHGRLGHLRLSGGPRPGIVLAESLTHRGHPLEGELGNGALLLRQRSEHIREVLFAGTQALGLGALGQFGGRREVGSVGSLRPAGSATVSTCRLIVSPRAAALAPVVAAPTAIAPCPVTVAIVPFAPLLATPTRP